MPFSRLLTEEELLRLLRKAEEKAERTANEKIQKKEVATQRRVVQEIEKTQKQKICKQKKEERERLKMEQQCIREEKQVEKKECKKRYIFWKGCLGTDHVVAVVLAALFSEIGVMLSLKSSQQTTFFQEVFFSFKIIAASGCLETCQVLSLDIFSFESAAGHE
ncbi:hypothetical protein C2G38_2217965 [Gigaspora rosea]|uniref:Uncharacterized protein n=1 Tax=Gigaspora rosea TaxID=44941 RepID=A0A397U779_9GLOM|nr:hypothetical protein C2G38_2217965 [Gigaspora rosea]